MTATSPAPLTYAAAGVDIDAGNALVERIKPLAKSTARAGVMGALGGFGALFDVKALGMNDPILVATTDGVGTKLKIALAINQHRTIGIDLVAMCVNDLIVQGAQPLFFLDYFATGKLDVEVATQVMEGIAEGCKQAGCALIGGETAEMPGMYPTEEYDLAGFSLGAVERDGMLPRQSEMKEGSVLLGLASSGVHSNGFSLVRKVMERAGVSYTDACPFLPGKNFGEAWLEPTRIYVKAIQAAQSTGGILGMAHITGGGIIENLPRVLPAHLQANVLKASWRMPDCFAWLQEAGNIPDADLWRTFNAGMGMIVVVDKHAAEATQLALARAGETVYEIGKLVARPEGAPAVVLA